MTTDPEYISRKAAQERERDNQRSRFAYESAASLTGPETVHHVSREPDATLCQQYIEYTDGWYSRPTNENTVECMPCYILWRQGIMDQARSDAAHELGVTEDEIF